MSEIQSNGGLPITPREQKMYEQEYKDGARLFQKALEQYCKSDSIFQKHEFEEVMEKAMNVLNQAANELKEKALLEQNVKIKQDYQSFMKDPTNQSGAGLLHKDLDQAMKKV
ncbi:MAG: hypothetical protein HY324_02255 [Chlamydiia bacterium]|nr:hypothetical protein [Chlamydiia bacterium]